MQIAELLLWALCVAGAALVLTQSSLTAPLRGALDRAAAGAGFLRRPAGLLAKLIACPMCSGFWLGALAARLFRVAAPGELAARAFAGSLASALAVQAWLWLGETAAAAGLWRYLHTPPPPDASHELSEKQPTTRCCDAPVSSTPPSTTEPEK